MHDVRHDYAHSGAAQPLPNRNQSRRADTLGHRLCAADAALVEHATAVAHLACMLATRLDVPVDEIARIKLAAVLHDIGTLALPASRLTPLGLPDRVESSLARMLALAGERMVRSAPSLSHTADLVRASHERIDGHGVPDGLAGAAIPLGARIIAVCDAFDALTTGAIFRAAMRPSEALDAMQRAAGTQFDQHVVDALCASARRRQGADDEPRRSSW